MKKTLWIALLLSTFASAASASAPAALEISAEDLATAGIQGVVAVAPEHDRFQPPVAYFRVAEKLSAEAAKADCGGCGNLVAAYAATVSSVPSWVAESKMQFVKVGGRLQLRAYIASKKRVVIVTAPSETAVRKISAALVSKFSK